MLTSLFEVCFTSFYNLESNTKISEELEHMTAEYKELNDQTYTEVSDIIMRNTGKLQELDDKIKIEWRNTVENFEHIIEDFRDNLTAKLNTLNDKSKQRATKMKDI